jgi:hypothetical protein
MWRKKERSKSKKRKKAGPCTFYFLTSGFKNIKKPLFPLLLFLFSLSLFTFTFFISMWTIRANLVKLAATQRSSVHVLGYCRGFKTIIGDPVSTSDNKETEADKATAPSPNASTNADSDKPPQHLTEAISDSKDGQADSSTPHSRTEAASTEDTSPPKKPYSKRRQARRLSQILKNKVIQHARKPTLIEPSLTDETIQDLDDTWRPLDSHSKYQRKLQECDQAQYYG